MSFVKFTDHANHTVYINTVMIFSVSSKGTQTWIHSSVGFSHVVNDPISEVMRIIIETRAEQP